MSLGNDFIGGFSAVRAAKDRYAQRKQDAAEAAMERELKLDLAAKNLAADQPVKTAQAANLTANADRTKTLTPGELAELTARASHIAAQTNRINTLTPAEALQMGAQTTSLRRRDRQAKIEGGLDAKMKQTELERAQAVLERDRAGKPARVKQPYGDEGGTIEFEVPMAEAQREASRNKYTSPFAQKIADLGSSIAENETEIAGGDTRTGFLGVGRARADDITKASRQRTRLQALELQDMLEKGVIDQAEADRRAARLLPSR